MYCPRTAQHTFRRSSKVPAVSYVKKVNTGMVIKIFCIFRKRKRPSNLQPARLNLLLTSLTTCLSSSPPLSFNVYFSQGMREMYAAVAVMWSAIMC